MPIFIIACFITIPLFSMHNSWDYQRVGEFLLKQPSTSGLWFVSSKQVSLTAFTKDKIPGHETCIQSRGNQIREWIPFARPFKDCIVYKTEQVGQELSATFDNCITVKKTFSPTHTIEYKFRLPDNYFKETITALAAIDLTNQFTLLVGFKSGNALQVKYPNLQYLSQSNTAGTNTEYKIDFNKPILYIAPGIDDNTIIFASKSTVGMCTISKGQAIHKAWHTVPDYKKFYSPITGIGNAGNCIMLETVTHLIQINPYSPADFEVLKHPTEAQASLINRLIENHVQKRRSIISLEEEGTLATLPLTIQLHLRSVALSTQETAQNFSV